MPTRWPHRRHPARLEKKLVSFGHELWLSAGTPSDWPYFARWHYRSHHLGIVRRVMLLWHGREPVGICVFTTPARALAARSRFFGLSGRWNRLRLQILNQQLVTLSRVVLHPTYRGAGVATAFVRASCRHCPWPWIETLAEMGRLNPFFERAGFVRVGSFAKPKQSRRAHSALYGGRREKTNGRERLVSRETHAKSRHAEPVYFIFDNRHSTTDG